MIVRVKRVTLGVNRVRKFLHILVIKGVTAKKKTVDFLKNLESVLERVLHLLSGLLSRISQS